jgi:hypothetical protein
MNEKIARKLGVLQPLSFGNQIAGEEKDTSKDYCSARSSA